MPESPTYSQGDLPSDPATWGQYRKEALTLATRVEGPFTVETATGPVEVGEDGAWIAIDSMGHPYPMTDEQFGATYGQELSLPPTPVMRPEMLDVPVPDPPADPEPPELEP